MNKSVLVDDRGTISLLGEFANWNLSLKDSLATQLEANPALVKFLAKIFKIKE